MSRKIQTSCGKRRFYHQTQNNNNSTLESNIIRPPTSHPYSCLNNYRSSTKIRNQYESNYFTGKLLFERKNKQANPQQKVFPKSKLCITQDQFEQIPKAFKLMFTQIKVLFKNSICEEDQVKQVLRNLHRRTKQIHNENNDLKIKLQSKDKQLSHAKNDIERLNLKIKEFKQHKSSISQSKDLVLFSSADKNKSQFQIMLQNLHLTQLNQSYLATIKQLKQNYGQKQVQVKRQNGDTDSTTQMLRFHNRINYLEMKITNSQNIQNQLNLQNQSYILKINELNFQIFKLKQQLDKALYQRNQWRERGLMQKEDSQTNITRQNFLLFSIKKLRQVNKNLTDKILNVNSEDGSKKMKQLQPNPYFQYEIDFFRSLKSVYFEAKLKEYRLSLQNKKQSFQIEAIGMQQGYLEQRKHEQINMVGLNYLRPTFFSFIEECITNDIYTCRVKGSTSISRIFIQVLRAILNCKVNEFLISSCEQKFTRFPQFVYSWFQKFYFNQEKSEVSALQPYMQKPISQDLFYHDLMNVKLDQSWQIITFRQFLLQQLNLEQLYFYLMCQNLLYKKAGINDQIQYLGQFCILVEFSAAKSVLDLVLSDFQSWNISFLTSKLRQKIIIKKNVEYLQSGFFLRCLVEYYKIQRVNRYKYITKLCDQFKSCEQNGLRFSSFISVINRFTQISSEQKMRLYRDCYSVGRGKITSDVIFTVCTEQLVFLRYLKLKCFYRLPTLTFYKELRKNKKKSSDEEQIATVAKKQIICVQPSDSYIYDIFIGLNRLLRNQKSFNKRIQKLGVSDILHHFDMIKKLFGEKSSSNDSSLLKCRHFVHFIANTMQKIRQISFQNFYDLLDENNKKRGDSSFWIEIPETELCEIFTEEFKVTLNIFERVNHYRQWKEQVYNFRVNNAARKIQRQVRKKFIQPFMQLYKMIYSELKKQDIDPKTKDKIKEN